MASFLPKEILDYLLTFLDQRDLINLKKVDKRFSQSSINGIFKNEKIYI